MGAGSESGMSDDHEAAIEAASRAIEAMPRRDYPNMVDTSAWGTPSSEPITVTYDCSIEVTNRLNLDARELPAGWITIERMKAELGDAGDTTVNPT